MRVLTALGLRARDTRHRGRRARRTTYAPAMERMEDRLVPSGAAGDLFSILGPYVDQKTPPGGQDLGPAVPAVGTYLAGGVERPFIAVTYQNGVGGVLVFLSDGNGGFVTPPTIIQIGDASHPAGSEGVIVGHFTDSGADDIAVASDGSFNADNPGSVVVIRGDGAGHFSPTPQHLPLPSHNLVMPDLLASTTIGTTPYLFVSDFSGFPPDATGGANEVLVYKGDGAGSFTLEPPLHEVSKPESIIVGDFNNDGHQDLAVVNAIDPNFPGATHPPHNSVSIFQGDDTGQFTYVANIPIDRNVPPKSRPAKPVVMTMGDFNGDGKPDLAVLDALAPHSVSVLQNQSVDKGPISFGSRPALTIKSGRFSDGIAAVNLGDVLTGLAVSGRKSIYILHNRGQVGGPIRFRRPARIKLGAASDPGNIVAANLANPGSATKYDLIVVNQKHENIMVLKSNLTHT